MLVRELINDSDWLPSKDYGSSQPSVSVILPTYRRGESGMFLEAAHSVLSQTFHDLELIIIDDASTDGTHEQILSLMDKDNRVSCIHHRRNVGLPAISEYEGFMKSRGEHIAFAFDDDIFETDAIESLHRHLVSNKYDFVYGNVNMMVNDHLQSKTLNISLGSPLFPESSIELINKISNNSVLIKKDVLNDVGLYDPRPALMRFCDWDLWIRISRRYDLNYLNKTVGVVRGPSTDDSLGATRGVELWAASELMNEDRNPSLSPQLFESFDVLSFNKSFHPETQKIIQELNTQYLNRCSLKPISSENKSLGHTIKKPTTPQHRVLVSTTTNDACTSLYFNSAATKEQLRLINPTEYREPELVRASAFIVVRGLFEHKSWISMAHHIGVPTYWFIDDNFMVLKEEASGFENYSMENVREALKPFSGVLAASEPLVAYVREHDLHSNVLLYPPIFTGALKKRPPILAPKRAGTKRILFFGGTHRTNSWEKFVLPAIERLSHEHSLELISFSHKTETTKNNEIEISHVPFDYDYHRALAKIAECEIDFLIHPSTSSLNAQFKTIHALINAVALNATLVTSSTPPFLDYHRTGAFVLAEDTAQDWHRVLNDLLQHENKNKLIQETATRFCSEHFAGKKNQDAIDSLLKDCNFVDSVEIDRRWRSLTEYYYHLAHDQEKCFINRRSPQAQKSLKGIGRRIEKRFIRPVLKSAKTLLYKK